MSSNSETFRPARADEVGELVELAMHSFPAAHRDREWWERHLTGGGRGDLASSLIAEESGRPTAFCQLLPLRQWIGGRLLSVMGLSAVTVAPDRRRRGLATRLLVAGFRAARERGDVASALYPFRIGYYRQLGYGLAGEAHQYLVPPSTLPHDAAALARMHLVRTPADELDMLAVYEAAARTQTGQMQRSQRSWPGADERDEHRAAVIYRDETGTASGYVMVRYRPDLPLSSRWLEVEERMWLTPDARAGVYSWLASLADQWPRILYRAHPDEGFGEIVEEPRLPADAGAGWQLWFPSATLMVGPMFRLLDVPGAFAQRSLKPGPPLAVKLSVTDERLPENSGAWRLELGDARIDVTAGSGAADVELTTSVSTISRIFIGATTIQREIAAGRVTIDSPERAALLDSRMHVPLPWTFDRF